VDVRTQRLVAAPIGKHQRTGRTKLAVAAKPRSSAVALMEPAKLKERSLKGVLILLLMLVVGILIHKGILFR